MDEQIILNRATGCGELFRNAIQLGRFFYRWQVEAMCQAFPAVTWEDIQLLAFIFRRQRTKEGYIPLSAAEVVRHITGDPQARQTPHIRVKAMVDHLMASMPGLHIALSEYNKDTGLARDILAFHMPPALAEILYDDHMTPLRRDELIDVATGDVITDSDRRQAFRERGEALDYFNATAPLAWQREFLPYLNGLDTRRFIIEPVCMADARCLAWSLPEPGRRMAMANLDAIALNPKPVYHWVEGSARLFSDGYSLATVKSSLRRALLPGLVEVDLRNAQAAAFAKVMRDYGLAVPLLDNILRMGDSLWDVILQALGIPTTDLVYRSAVKTGTYALCFGSRWARVFNEEFTDLSWREQQALLAEDALQQFRRRLARKFSRVPVIAEMLQARNELFQRMERRQIDLTDAYGRVQVLGETDETKLMAPAAFARVLQSWEQRLMEPVRQVALGTQYSSHAVAILIYQHDGASLRFRRQDEITPKLRKLQADVRSHALSLGIDTTLEVKYAPPTPSGAPAPLGSARGAESMILG